MIHGRALFENLVKTNTVETDVNQKEIV
jgi:hypothetical protein